jgi:hypothetical protein
VAELLGVRGEWSATPATTIAVVLLRMLVTVPLEIMVVWALMVVSVPLEIDTPPELVTPGGTGGSTPSHSARLRRFVCAAGENALADCATPACWTAFEIWMVATPPAPCRVACETAEKLPERLDTQATFRCRSDGLVARLPGGTSTKFSFQVCS